MTNAKKVKVSKEVAEAIKDVRSVGYTDFQIIQDIVEYEGKTAYGTKMPVLIRFAKYSTENQQTLILALVNGYEVEQTPSEQVAFHYETNRLFSNITLDYERGVARGVMKGIEFVVEAYGLKIEGVDVN